MEAMNQRIRKKKVSHLLMAVITKGKEVNLQFFSCTHYDALVPKASGTNQSSKRLITLSLKTNKMRKCQTTRVSTIANLKMMKTKDPPLQVGRRDRGCRTFSHLYLSDGRGWRS